MPKKKDGDQAQFQAHAFFNMTIKYAGITGPLGASQPEGPVTFLITADLPGE